uniref:Uncharacterized protein n=1 Tax=Catagonus wagneri TaxID=51154 RepID=A0A8C3W1P0_9CETA
MPWLWRRPFCLLCPGVHSQAQLLRPGFELREPGSSPKLSCKAPEYAFSSYAMGWT